MKFNQGLMNWYQNSLNKLIINELCMTNSRQKGKRIERYFKNKLKKYFPFVERNANGQSQSGGVDLLYTGKFDFEIKGGKQAKIKKIRSWLDQVENEGRPKEDFFKIVLVHPDREEDFVIMTYQDFEVLLKNYIENS